MAQHVQEVQKVWKCGNCTYHNDEKDTKCSMCFVYERSTADISFCPFYSNTSPIARSQKYGCVMFLASHEIKQQILDAYNAYRTNGNTTKIFIYSKHDIDIIKTGLSSQLAQYEGSISHGITCNFWSASYINQNFDWFKATIDDEFKAFDLKTHLRSGRDIIIPCGSTHPSLDPNEFCQSVENDKLKAKYIQYIEHKIKENAEFEVIRKVSMITQPKPRVRAQSDAVARPSPPRRRPAMLLDAIRSGPKLRKAEKPSERKKVMGAVSGGMFDTSEVKLRSTKPRDRSQSVNAKPQPIDYRRMLKKSNKKMWSKEDGKGNNKTYKTEAPSWMKKVKRRNGKQTIPIKKEHENGKDCGPSESIYTDSKGPQLLPPPPPLETRDVIPQCALCGAETREGREDEGDNQFYCSDCWMQWDDAYVKKDVKVKRHSSPQKQNKPREPASKQFHGKINSKQLLVDIRGGKKLKKTVSEPQLGEKPKPVMNKQQSEVDIALFEELDKRRGLVADSSSDMNSDSDWNSSQ